MAIFAVSATSAFAGDEALPRVAVRDGAFVTLGPDGQAAEPFQPRGFNYIRLRSAEHAWHWTFTDDFDRGRAAGALADMSERGFNLVRVFISPWPPNGIVATRESDSFKRSYVNYVLEFLRLARANDIYVVFAMDGPPPSARYRRIIEAGPEAPFDGRNLEYLHRPHAQAKAQYMADLAAEIRDADPTLLSTVFSYELENETYFDSRSAPFTARSEGEIELNGQTYQMGDPNEIQRMVDDGMAMTAELCAEAVREIDPEAMVSVNVFTFAAVGRSGPAAFHEDETGDRRIPARPLALVGTSLDYLDIHLYSPTEAGLARDLASVEWPELSAAAAEAGQPIIMGEFGSFKGRNNTVEDAVEAMDAHIRRVMAEGFVGWMHWTYDTWEQPYIWHATEADNALLDRLTELRTLTTEQAAASLGRDERRALSPNPPRN